MKKAPANCRLLVDSDHVIRLELVGYLMSQSGSVDSLAQCACGLLLHPAIGQSVDETVVIQGHPIRFATVDLTAPALAIRQQLLDVLNFPLH